MLIDIPYSLHAPEANQDVFVSRDIELIQYNNPKGDCKNEIILNKNLFLFIREGKKKISVYNENLVLNKNSGAVIIKGTYVMSEIISNKSGKFSSLMILVGDETLIELWQKIKALIDVKDDRQPSGTSNNWSYFSQTSFIQSSLQTLEMYIKNINMIPHTLLITKLQELLIYLIQSPDALDIEQLIKQISSGKKNCKLREFMEKNFTQHWTVEQFAYNYGFSLSTFKRIFKEAYGKAPKLWINNRRLEQAIIDLNSKNIPLVDLALNLGFSDSSQFSKAFRNKYNTSPSLYKS